MTDRAQYTRAPQTPQYADAVVGIRLTNLGNRVIGYTLCDVTLQRREGDGWVVVNPQPAQPPCAAMRYGLDPKATADAGRLTLPSDAGVYRYRLNDVQLGDSSTPIPEADRSTESFTVTP